MNPIPLNQVHIVCIRLKDDQRRLQSDTNISIDARKEITKIQDIRRDDLKPLFSGFYPILSRELPFGIAKFLAVDIVATTIVSFINSLPQVVEPVEVGIGSIGLAVSAFSGAIAGLAGATVSHPADLILTLTSASKTTASLDSKSDKFTNFQNSPSRSSDWRPIVQELLSKPGGVTNLFVGLGARSAFFFLVIGFQFFLYDYAKTLLRVGSDDLSLVLDVFYAIRQGLVSMQFTQ